jgi:hypothetical protein
MKVESAVAPKFVVFAGAGASAAVDSVQFPTTARFLENLKIPTDPRSLLAATTAFLKHRHGQGAVFDIEQVLWELAKLDDWLKEAADEQSVCRFFLSEARFARVLSLGSDFQSFLQTIDPFRQRLAELKSSIEEQVFGFYGRPPRIEQLHGNWIPLLSSLGRAAQRGSGTLEIFTTNYDLVIETALAELVNYELKIETGRRPHVQMLMDFNAWQDPRPDRLGMLTKMHGSVD